MDPATFPHMRYTSDDISPDTPHITLALVVESPVPGQLSLTLPYWITVKLPRKWAGTSDACLLRWTPRQPFLSADVVLLRLTEQGSERVRIVPQADRIGAYQDASNGTEIDESVHEFLVDSHIELSTKLPMNYQGALKAGEQYQMYWPGGEIDMWDWGSVHRRKGTPLKSRRDSGSQLPRLIIPASKPITFTAVEEAEPWPGRPPTTNEQEFQAANEAELRWRNTRNPTPLFPALGPDDRVADAPILSMAIDCPREWPKATPIDVELKVTYEQDPSGDARPITFHVTAFTCEYSQHSSREGFYLYEDKYAAWKVYVDPDPPSPGFAIWDNPPIPAKAGDAGQYDSSFVTLRPGETWTCICYGQGKADGILPDNARAGDKFMYRHEGAIVDWWDCGSKEDHKQTDVKLHCVIGCDLEEPKHNGRRPKLVVPGSNEVVFTYVG